MSVFTWPDFALPWDTGCTSCGADRCVFTQTHIESPAASSPTSEHLHQEHVMRMRFMMFLLRFKLQPPGLKNEAIAGAKTCSSLNGHLRLEASRSSQTILLKCPTHSRNKHVHSLSSMTHDLFPCSCRLYGEFNL